MSVSTTNVFNQYTAGSSHAFPFQITFYVRSATWLKVYIDNVLQGGGAYNTVLNSDQNATPGGNIVFLADPTPGAVIRIQRDTPVLQPDVYSPFSPFPAQTVEYDFDRGVCIMQELDYQLSLINIPSPVGQGGKFLSSDNTNFIWADVLPKPYVTGLVLGATSPTTLDWVPGGGGGGGIFLGPFDTTPNADGLTLDGVLFNVLHLAAADATHPGGVSLAKQTFAGEKLHTGGSSTHIFDIRNYGALPAPDQAPSNALHDCSPAIEAAIAAWAQSQCVYPVSIFGGRPTGGVYIPPGFWYISRPITMPPCITLFGAGPTLSCLVVGPGTPSTPSLVQGFGGPMIYYATDYNFGFPPPQTNMPIFGAPLVGATGQSITFDVSGHTSLFTLPLNDAYPWLVLYSTFPGLQFTLDGWFQINQLPATINGEVPLFGSCGPRSWTNHPDRAFGIWAFSDTTQWKVRVYMTIADSTVFTTFKVPMRGNEYVQTSGTVVTHNVPFHVALTYDGTFISFWVNGIFQSRVSAPGSILQCPWEVVTFGAAGPEILDYAGSYQIGIDSSFGGTRLSKIARHTGTANFTPPTSYETWDSNTLALYNWLDPAPTTNSKPFVMGQTAILTDNFTSYPTPGTQGGPVPHYIRIPGGALTDHIHVSDLMLQCHWATSGIQAWAAPFSQTKDLLVVMPNATGMKISDGVSFFTIMKNIEVWWSLGPAAILVADMHDLKTEGCQIGLWAVAGKFSVVNDQPSFNSFTPLVIGGIGGAEVSAVEIDWFASDQEAWDFTRQIAGAVVFGGEGQFDSRHSFYSSQGAHGNPVKFFGGAGFQSSMRFSKDTFLVGADATCYLEKANPFPGKAWLDDCNFNGSLPYSNQPGWVVFKDAITQTLQAGISISDTPRRNLSGTFTIEAGFTTGGPSFFDEEVDDKYDVRITPKGYVGSAPAAGSWRIKGYTTAIDGFTAEVEADPAGTCILTFSWEMIGNYGGPDVYVPLPAVPSTHANPFAGQVNEDWIASVSLVPVTGDLLAYYSGTTAVQALMEAGDASTANFWGASVANVVNPQLGAGTSPGSPINPWISRRGQFCCLQSPGYHNIMWGNYGGLGVLYMDGGQFPSDFAYDVGIQQTPITFGQHYDGSETLVDATLRNGKLSHLPSLSYTKEQRSGPQSGQQLACILGDHMVYGAGASVPTGGFAPQIAQARYTANTFYYYLAGIQNWCWSDVPGIRGIWANMWYSWTRGRSALQTLALIGGQADIIITTNTAAEILGGIQNIVEGTQAQAQLVMPSSGTATFTLNGILFTIPFNTTVHQTCLDMITLINASAPTLAVMTPTLQINDSVLLTAVVRGSAGNSIPVSTNGAFGAAIYSFSNIIGATFLTGAGTGAIDLGIPNIVISNVAPVGDSPAYTGSMNVRRTALNTLIANYCTAHAGDGVVLADVDGTLASAPGSIHINPAYLVGADITLNDAGHTAMFGLIDPLVS